MTKIPCANCGQGSATWNETLCSDCASRTEDEIPEYCRTGRHPRMPLADKWLEWVNQ